MKQPEEEIPPTSARTMVEAQEHNASVSAARLSRRLNWGGLLLFSSFLVPYEVVGGHPLFIWQVLGELSWGARAAAFSLSLAGVALFVASYAIKRAADQATVAFASFAAVLIASALGADASAWDALSVPDGLGDRPALLILVFASAGAGATLVGQGAQATRRGRFLLRVSPFFALLIYLLPFNGFVPIVGVWELIELTLRSGDVRYQLGYGMITATTLLPAIVCAFALLLAARPPKRTLLIPPLLMTYALPAAFSLFIFRSLLITLGNSSILANALGLMPLVAALGIAAAALEVLAVEPQPARRFLFSSLGAVAATAGIMWPLSRPPEKGVNWKLTTPTAQADSLFGETLSKWNKKRRGWGTETKAKESTGSAKEYVRTRKAGMELIKEATHYNTTLVTAFRDLVFESKDLDLAGRRWYRMIHELNEQSRLLGLPYYVDPEVDIVANDNGVELLFDLETYRIRKVRAFDVDGRSYATLHVIPMGKRRRNHSLLGFSRDFQPFALVALDEIESHATDLKQWAEAEPPICFGGDPRFEQELLLCGKNLQAILLSRQDISSVVSFGVERHELQHQIDGPHLPIAREVTERMGPYTTWARGDVNRELSAHLAELTTTEGSPHLELILIYGNAYRGKPRGKYTHAAVLVLEALLGEKLPEAGGYEVREGRRTLSTAYQKLSSLSEDELRSRAKRAWEEMYGGTLHPVKFAN